MTNPGVKVGPMGLPVSYHISQLEHFGWDGEVFRYSKKGQWRSKLNVGTHLLVLANQSV